MKYRPLGRSGWYVSEVSFGAWAVGGSWGTVDEGEARGALQRAAVLGVNFFDTADVSGDGRSERLVGELSRDFPDIRIATKAGRRLDPHVAEIGRASCRERGEGGGGGGRRGRKEGRK